MTSNLQAGIVCLLAVASVVYWDLALGQRETDVVVGPRNTDLQDGARALEGGDAAEGVRLTHLGLNAAISTRERRIGLSNLCAGYVLLDELDKALNYCNQALELTPDNWRVYNNRALIHVLQRRFDAAESDLEAAERLNPHSKSTVAVRRLLRNTAEPVAPMIEIDDRRQSEQEDAKQNQ